MCLVLRRRACLEFYCVDGVQLEESCPRSPSFNPNARLTDFISWRKADKTKILSALVIKAKNTICKTASEMAQGTDQTCIIIPRHHHLGHSAPSGTNAESVAGLAMFLNDTEVHRGRARTESYCFQSRGPALPPQSFTARPEALSPRDRSLGHRGVPNTQVLPTFHGTTPHIILGTVSSGKQMLCDKLCL